MQSWCTWDQVAARVAGSPAQSLCQEFADQATSILYAMTGRKFGGVQTLTASIGIDRRGYLKLVSFQPVNSVSNVSVAGSSIDFALSPAGTFVTVDQSLCGQIATVTMSVGQSVPVAGVSAAAALAADLLKGDPRYAATGATDVRASSRILSVNRQGVSYTFIDPVTLQEKDMTGVQEVDLFIRAVNPNGSRYQPKVVSTT